MRHTLWILAVATLAVQLVMLLFGAAIARALLAANVTLRLLSTTTYLTVNALLIVTAAAGVYAAGRARRGAWVALLCVALVLGLYGPVLSAMALPFVRIAGPRFVYVEALDVLLEALVPIVALVYVLRDRPGHGGVVGATTGDAR